jgi:hypothetical protein
MTRAEASTRSSAGQVATMVRSSDHSCCCCCCCCCAPAASSCCCCCCCCCIADGCCGAAAAAASCAARLSTNCRTRSGAVLRRLGSPAIMARAWGRDRPSAVASASAALRSLVRGGVFVCGVAAPSGAHIHTRARGASVDIRLMGGVSPRPSHPCTGTHARGGTHTTQHKTAQHRTQHITTQHNTTQHNTTQHITEHSTSQHSTLHTTHRTRTHTCTHLSGSTSSTAPQDTASSATSAGRRPSASDSPSILAPTWLVCTASSWRCCVSRARLRGSERRPCVTAHSARARCTTACVQDVG